MDSVQERADVAHPADDRFPLYTSQQAMADVVIDELIRSAALRRQGYGGLFHIINHATALTELSRFGYRELARKGWPAHHHHVRFFCPLVCQTMETHSAGLATFVRALATLSVQALPQSRQGRESAARPVADLIQHTALGDREPA